jgi:hypothetical protein
VVVYELSIHFASCGKVIAEPKELIRIIRNLKREKKKLIGGL